MPVNQGPGLAPYDPTQVRPDVHPEQPPEPPVEPPQPMFDPKYVKPLNGLLFIGALTTSFDGLGRTFVLRPLTPCECRTFPSCVTAWPATGGEAADCGGHRWNAGRYRWVVRRGWEWRECQEQGRSGDSRARDE